MRPKVSEVLTTYLKQCNEPPWTSYFIKVNPLIKNKRTLFNLNFFLDKRCAK